MSETGDNSDNMVSLTSFDVKLSGLDISPTLDNGLYKNIIRPGNGGEQPLKGNKIHCHYVGKLVDGSVFDSSRERDEQFTFSLGKGQVIRGWDVAIATMCRGEVAEITCSPYYGYGSAGQPPRIPANAVLMFEIELINFEEEDLSAAKDGSILRSQYEEGTGYKLPNEGAFCEVHLIGRHEGRVFEERDVACCLGDGDLVPGLELALRNFKHGERSRVTVGPRHAYGELGCDKLHIPPNATLTYDVTLKSFEKTKEAWEMDGREKLDQSEIVKKKGNDLFKQGRWKPARQAYERVLAYLQTDAGMGDEEKALRDTLLLAAHLNVAMCCLKLGEHRTAVTHCDKALTLDSKNEKALYRRGKAYTELQEFTKAIDDFKSVLSVDGSNKDARDGLTTAQHRLRQSRDKDKKTYAGMFTKFAQIDSKNDAPARREDVFTDVAMWNNDLAAGMMTLEQEAEAFGETPPAPRYNLPGGGLDDLDEGKENENPAFRDEDDF